jgi:hypothetical protein
VSDEQRTKEEALLLNKKYIRFQDCFPEIDFQGPWVTSSKFTSSRLYIYFISYQIFDKDSEGHLFAFLLYGSNQTACIFSIKRLVK